MAVLFRSEKMAKCQLFLQTDASYACVAELGELGLVQFRDLNPDVSAFQRKFVSEVRRCDEMERRLRFFEKEIRKEHVPIPDNDSNPDAPQPREMVDIEATLEQLEQELREINTNQEMLNKNFLELTELRHILSKTQHFFDEREDIHARRTINESSYENPALELDGEAVGLSDKNLIEKEQKSDLTFVAGVISRNREMAFERLLWRACRGNVFMRKEEITEPLYDPITEDPVLKSVFVIFFQGEQLKSRVKKICDGFRATLYPCPSTPHERREMSLGVMARLEDLKAVMNQTRDHKNRDLRKIGNQLRIWITKVRKMKAIYHTLNLFNLDVTQKCLIAEWWCPDADLDKIRLALKRGNDESGSVVPSIINKIETSEIPPTYHRTNKFTQGFQNIVDAYGIASYREANPALFTIITFPFLFAVMFGDFGHGMIMFLAALTLVVFERKLESMRIKDEIFGTFFGGRYIILLMGLFSMYTGLVYNELYSRSMNVYGSMWKMSINETTAFQFLSKEGAAAEGTTVFLDPKWASSNQSSYPFGIDPIWNVATNRLNFTNSFKMKMSVILGIAQMFFGVVLSFLNYRHFKQAIDTVGVFLPQILFLSCIFVYLCGAIITKWLLFSAWPTQMAVGYYPGPHCAPSLLIGLINMFMFRQGPPGFINATDHSNPVWNTPQNELPSCELNQWYPGERYVEMILVLIGVVCIPWMLLSKPLFLRWKNKKRTAGMHVVKAKMSSEEDVEVVKEKEATSHGGGHGHAEEFEFSEVFIHQSIHTIEFCLGCISHTASYLRLWALSLAHSELSEVLWTMILRNGLTITTGYAGSVAIFIVFWAFSALTVAVLVLMEGLSAFLHALRLHWVEFQSKFYGGEGFLFIPFSFDIILEEARAAESTD